MLPESKSQQKLISQDMSTTYKERDSAFLGPHKTYFED